MPSPFEKLLRDAGGVLRPVEGASYPIRFAHPFEEHAAVRAAAGLVDLSFLGKLEIAGPDAREFLQRISSADLSKLAAGEGKPNYLLNGQGKIVQSFEALATPDGFLCVTESGGADALRKAIEALQFSERVTYRDFSEDLGALLLAGPRAEEILATAAGSAVPGAAPLPSSGTLHHTMLRVGGGACLAVRDRRAGEDGFLLLVPRPSAEAVFGAIVEAGKPRGLVFVGLAAYDSLRLEAGIARFGLDFGGDLFPQEAGDVDAFSLTKGCYPGQETVARIDTYGKTHRVLTGVVLDSPNEDLPEKGDKLLLGEEEVGDIRSWAISPALERPIALAVVRTAKAPAGSTLEIRSGGRTLTAKVVGRPIAPRDR